MSSEPAETNERVAFGGRIAARSRPGYLAVIGRLRGVQPADADQARVLEVDCGSGQNLISLALRSPRGTFLGLDRSGRAVAMARRIAGELALTNVEFRHQDTFRSQDLGERPRDLGTFDYVIAREAYSTSTADERDALLAGCRELLAPSGLVYLGYKTYPGWHVHDMLRAMMLYDGRGATTSRQRATTARALAEFLDSTLLADEPYDKHVRGELQAVLQRSNAAIEHDYLQPANHAEYVTRFVAHARRHALQPVGDAALGVRAADDLGAEAEQRLDELSSDPIKKELYRDMIRNRRRREAVLCHAEVTLSSEPAPALLGGLYLAAPLQPRESHLHVASTAVERFVTPQGLQISTAVPLIKAALVHLGRRWPNFISCEELIATASAAVTATSSQPIAAGEVERLKENLLLCAQGGILELDSQTQSFTTQLSPRPRAHPLARWQVQHGDRAINCQHRAMRLPDFDPFVLQLLDGTRDRSQLIEQLAEWTAEGRLPVFERQQRVVSADRAAQIFAALVPYVLARLAQNAFLTG